MNERTAHALSAMVAVVVETACVVIMVRAFSLDLSLAFAMAVLAGYVTLYAALHILGPSDARGQLGDRLRSSSLFGLGALLVAEAMVYVAVGLADLGLAATNALVLAAVICWTALGWRFMDGRAPEL